MKRLLLAALVAGACGGEDGGGEPIAPKLSALQTKIFTPRCGVGSSCHAGDDPREGLSLVAPVRPRIVGQPSRQVPAKMLVVAGDPAASYLFEKVSSAKPAVGARMPYTADPLSAAELAALRTWIENGAVED